MRKHCEIGSSILRKSDCKTFVMAAEIAHYHHEKWDGSGYPDGLIGNAIPESARIVAVADVFDALTMKRPYKEAWSIADSVAEIQKGSGIHFEPRLVQLFMEIFPQILQIRDKWDQ